MRIIGKVLAKMGKIPLPIRPGESIAKKHEEVKRTIKFQPKKVAKFMDLATAIGKSSMTEA